jgi:hypothetical protein
MLKKSVAGTCKWHQLIFRSLVILNSASLMLKKTDTLNKIIRITS